MTILSKRSGRFLALFVSHLRGFRKQFFQAPSLGGQSGLLRWRHLDRRMSPTKVVKREEQRHGRFVVLPFLRVGIRQTGQAANLHPQGLVVPLDVRSAYSVFIGIAQPSRRYYFRY